MDSVAKQLEDILRAYQAKPELIREHYNGEESDRRGYAGRPLLELIQNVEDALADAEQRGDMLLALTDGMLTIANQGTPFSERGFQALCDRNDSPNRRSQRFVGSKGTGFKAVLNWSDGLEIYSGAIGARFDRVEAATRILEAVCDEGRTRLDADGHWPDSHMPLLRVPLPAIPDQRMCQLLGEGWATVIRLHLFPDRVTEVGDQLRSLDPRDLLFLSHLGEVTLRLDGVPLTWTLHRHRHRQTQGVESHDLEVLKDGRTHASYRVLRRRLPDVRPEESDEVGDVEVALAYCTDAGDQATASYVYNFFPTECLSPLPAIAIHGTFLLTSDRNHLRKDDPSYQDALIAALSELCAEYLIPELVDRFGHRALNYLRPGPQVAGSSESVERVLSERLVGTVRSMPFVPTVSGRNVAPKDLRLWSHRLGDLLDEHPDAPDEPALPRPAWWRRMLRPLSAGATRRGRSNDPWDPAVLHQALKDLAGRRDLMEDALARLLEKLERSQEDAHAYLHNKGISEEDIKLWHPPETTKPDLPLSPPIRHPEPVPMVPPTEPEPEPIPPTTGVPAVTVGVPAPEPVVLPTEIPLVTVVPPTPQVPPNVPPSGGPGRDQSAREHGTTAEAWLRKQLSDLFQGQCEVSDRPDRSQGGESDIVIRRNSEDLLHVEAKAVERGLIYWSEGEVEKALQSGDRYASNRSDPPTS